MTAVQALLVISGKGTFRIDNQRIELLYLSHHGQWHVQLAMIERGFVFGRSLKSDIPRSSKMGAFIRLKHGVRKTFETLSINNSLGCVRGSLGERPQDMAEYRRAKHLLDYDRALPEGVEDLDIVPSSPSVVSMAIRPRPARMLRIMSEPHRSSSYIDTL